MVKSASYQIAVTSMVGPIPDYMMVEKISVKGKGRVDKRKENG